MRYNLLCHFQIAHVERVLNVSTFRYIVCVCRIAILLLVNVLPISAHAQNFKEGWIVTQAGDTVEGWIDLRRNIKNNDAIRFTSSLDIEATRFTPSDILAYRVLNYSYFQAREITFHEGDTELLFAEYLVEGKINLIKVYERFFVEDEAGKLYELYIEEKIVNLDKPGQKGRFLKKSTHHIGRLRTLMQDCPEVFDQMDELLTLHEKSLTRLVVAYNNCVGVKPTEYKERLPWIQTRLGVRTGVTTSSMRVVDASFTAVFVGDEVLTGWGPTGGIFAEFISPRLNNRLSVILGVDYVFHNYHHYYETVSGGLRNHYETNLAISVLNIPLGARHYIRTGKIWTFIEFGGFYNIRLDSQSDLIVEEVRDFSFTETSQVFTEFGEGPLTADYKLGLWGGTGVNIPLKSERNLSLTFRYKRITAFYESLNVIISNIGSIRNKTNNFELTLGWDFIP